MRTVTVGKSFDFHASHVLPNHNGKCARLHGHTYKVEVRYTGYVKDPCGESDEGMVIDFQTIKDVYKEYVEPHVEHQHLNDTLLRWLPHTLVSSDPNDKDASQVPAALTTCENIARWVHSVFHEKLITDRLAPSAHGQYVRVVVWETPTSFAVVPADRNGVEQR